MRLWCTILSLERDPRRVPRRDAARLDLRVPVRRGVRNVIADGDLAVAEWTSYVQAETGQAYQNDYAAVFRVRDGLITEVREYFDTAYAQRVLFGAE